MRYLKCIKLVQQTLHHKACLLLVPKIAVHILFQNVYINILTHLQISFIPFLKVIYVTSKLELPDYAHISCADLKSIYQSTAISFGINAAKNITHLL